MKYMGINLDMNLPAEESSKLLEMLKSLPLNIQGVKGKYRSNEENPVVLKVSQGKGRDWNKFTLESEKGSGVVVSLDDYLVREKGADCPNLTMHPGLNNKPYLEIIASFEDKSYLIQIFP